MAGKAKNTTGEDGANKAQVDNSAPAGGNRIRVGGAVDQILQPGESVEFTTEQLEAGITLSSDGQG